MSKQIYLFKKAVRDRLEDNTFLTLWDCLESWTQNDWMTIFFIIFLGIIFEIILVKICTSFRKKLAFPEKGSSDSQENEDSSLTSMTFDNWSIHSSSEERDDDFSERTITSSVTSNKNECYIEKRVSPADEIIWAGTSESKYQVRYFSGSHMASSHGTSSSLSLFHSEVKKVFLSHRGNPENEHKTLQFSSKKLFSIMKTNKSKSLVLSSDFHFSRTSGIPIESENLDVAPCPPAHLFLSRDQVRHLEENVRNQIPLKSSATLESETTLYSRSQDFLTQSQHFVRMDISAQGQDSFSGQRAIQNQVFYEAQFTSQAQQFVNNQDSINSQPDVESRFFAPPQDLMRKPSSSSTQDSFQTQDMDRSQHLLKVPYSLETQDSIKGLESDKPLDETQYAIWSEDTNKIKYSMQGQNTTFNNARFLVLTPSPNSVAKGKPHVKSVKPKSQKQILSSKLSHYSVCGLVPFLPAIKRQKTRRKILRSKSKFYLKVSSQKSKKTTTSWVFQVTLCHTSKRSKLGCEYATKKKELHQRKGISDKALHLIYVSKFVPPYIKKYSRKKLIKVLPGLTGCRNFLLKPNKSPTAEKVSFAGSIEKRGTSGNSKNVKQHSRDNKGLKNISPNVSPQLEQSFMVSTHQLKSPCSLLIETNWKNKESLKDPITQAKKTGIAEFDAPNSKKTSDLHIPKYETSLEEAISELLQKFVSSPKVKLNRMKTQEDLKRTENPHLPLSNGEKLPTSTPEMQKCLTKGNTQKQKNFLEIVLESSDINLLISLGTKKHKSNEQLADIKIKGSTEDVILKEKKPLKLTVTECDNLDESEKLECNTRSNIKNMHNKRISDAFCNATNTAISESPDIEMHSELKAKAGTSRIIGLSHSVVKQEKLSDRKIIWNANYNEKRCIFKKAQERDREEEEQILQEAIPKLESYAGFSSLKSGEAKIDEILFSVRECDTPCDANHQKEQAGGIEKKETFDCCMPAFSTSRRKRNFKQHSDMKTLVNPKCGILKAKKPSISYILNIKGSSIPKHRKVLRFNLTTKMKERDQGKKMANKMYSFMTIKPDINRYSKIEREEDMLGEKGFGSEQVKQVIASLEENIASDNTKETNLQGEEEEESEEETLLKIVPQYSQHFIFHSGQSREFDLQKSENKRGRKILFVTEQDVPQQMQPTDPVDVEKPKNGHQTQRGTMCTASSKLCLPKSKESLSGQVFMDTIKCDVPSDGSHTEELYSYRKELKTLEFKKDQQAAVLESLAFSTPDPSESKRQRKTCTCTALKSKMSSKCVIMKARKTPISQIFNIPGNGCLKKLPSKTLKSQIIDFLIHIKYFAVLEDFIAERKEGLVQELPATILESLDLSTLALPTSKRNNLKLIHKKNKMSPKCVTLKAKKAPFSQTFHITKCTPSHRRQFKCNFKTMMKLGKPVAHIILNAIFSAMPISLDMKVHKRIKVETDVPRKMRFRHELQQQERSPDGERASCASSSDKRGSTSNSTKEVKEQGREAALWNSQHFSFNAHEMKEPYFVKSHLELKNSARKRIPESLTIAQELQQRTLFAQSVLHSVSCSILNSLPSEKLPKRTKTQKGLKDTGSPKILSPMPGKSISESLIVTAQTGIPTEKSPKKELASSILERKIRLPKDLQARTVESFDFSMPASSYFKGQRNAAQIPKSRTGKAQMASVLKTVNMTRSGALSHGQEQEHILENVVKEISLGMSNIFINTFLSSAPVSPAIKRYNKVKARKGLLRQKSDITQLKQDEGKRLYTYTSHKCSTSSNTSESRRQNEKEEGNEILFESGLQFLNSVRSRKDQNMLITEQEVQQQAVVSENILESICSPLIPFQTEKPNKTISPQKDILHRIGEKIPHPKSEKATSDHLLIDETEYSTISDESPTKKLDVHSAVSIQPEKEKKDIKTQKVTQYTIDQNIPPTKSGNLSVLGDLPNKSSRRKMGDCIAKEHEELQKELPTRSTTSVFSESKRQKKILKSPERKNLTGPISATMKANKPFCSQLLNSTEHGNLCCRMEQEANLKSAGKDMQQDKNIANAFSSPIPVSTNNKIDTEMYSTLNTEMDQPRVKIHNHTYLELEKSPCYREAQKANSTDTRNRSSNTMKMNAQHEQEEKNIQKILESIPHYSQHFSFSAHHMKYPGPCKSKSELNSSEVKRTCNLSHTVQKMRQEKHLRELVLEPVSRNEMNFIQVETVKKSPHTHQGIKGVVDLKTSFPKAGKSETGSIQCDTLCVGNHRMKRDSPVSEKKAWNKNDLVTTFLKPLDFSSIVSSEPKSQSHMLEFVGKKSMSPKHVTLKAKKLPISYLLNIKRCLTGIHKKKKQHEFKFKIKERQWNENMREAIFYAMQGAKIQPPKLVIDKHSFDTTARGTLYNRTLHKNLNGHITEEMAELGENLSTTFLGPLDSFIPVLSDSESQLKTVQLSKKKIILNLKYLAMKKKEKPISQILKINRQFITKHRKKLRSNFKIKMKEMRQVKNVADKFPNTIYFTFDISDIKKQSRLETEINRVSRFSPIQPAQMDLPVEGLVISQSLNVTGHSALSVNKEQKQKIDVEREKNVLNADLKFIHASMPFRLHIKMDRLPSTWDINEEYSEKRNVLNKAKVREKEEYEKQVLFRTVPQYTQPFEFGADQMREPGSFKSEAPLTNTVLPKDITPQKTDTDLINQKAKTDAVEESSPESVFFSKIHPLQIEKQKKKFKTVNWKKIANSNTLIPKAEESLADMHYINTIKCDDSLQRREGIELEKQGHPALHNKQQEPHVSVTIWHPAYTNTPMYPKIIKHKTKAKAANMKNTVHTKQAKLKAKKPLDFQMLDTIGYGTQSNKKELRCNIKIQKVLQQGKTAPDVVLNDAESISSQVKGFLEVKKEKEKPRKLIHIPPQPKLNKSLRRKMSSSQSTNKSVISRNIKTLKQYIREQKEKHQIVLLDILSQCRDQLVISQQLKKEPDHVKLVVDLEREVYCDLSSQEREINYTRFDISQSGTHTEIKFLTAPRVKKGDIDVVKCSSSKGQNTFLTELDASQQKICKEQELLKQGSISMTNPGSIARPIMESPHLENIEKGVGEDMYINSKNISHLLRRQELKKTDTLQHSKGQKFLRINLEVQKNMSAVHKGEVKLDRISESILNPTSCPSREPLHMKQAVNITREENVSIPISLNVNLWKKDQVMLTNSPLKSDIQKMNFSEKRKAKQLKSSIQNKENILESISSCILHHLHIEKLKKEVSRKGMSSIVLSPMVEKSSNEADIPVDKLLCSEGIDLNIKGRKKHQQESICKVLPKSVPRSSIDIFQIKPPRVKKALKSEDRSVYHTSNAGKEEQQEYVHQTFPKLPFHSLRDIFQSKIPCKRKTSEEVVSTVDYNLSAEVIGSLIGRKGEQQEKHTCEALPKPVSHPKTGLLQINTSVQQMQLDDTNMVHSEYLTSQAKEASKVMGVIVGYTRKSEKKQNLLSIEQKQQHLLTPCENFMGHISYSQNDPRLLQHLIPQTKEALSEVGNVSSRAKGSDLFPKDQTNIVSACGLECIVPSIPSRQMKKQNTMLPLDSCSKTTKYLNVSFPKEKKSSNRAQVIDSISNGSSPKLRIRKKVQSCKKYPKNVQKEVCSPEIFLRSLSIFMPVLPESKIQKDSLKQRGKKGIICSKRTLKLKKSVFPNTHNITDYGNREGMQWNMKEKMVTMKQRKGKPDLVMANIYEFIPASPYLKLNKETIDGIISSNLKRTKHISQKKEKDRIKEINMKGRMDPNVISKAKKSSLSQVPNKKEIPGQIKQESKVQMGKSKPNVKLTNLCTSLPSLSYSNLNSRIKVGKDKSGIPRSCFLPPKLQASSNVRKTSFSESFNRYSLSNVIEPKHLPQKRRENRKNIVYVKDIMDLECIIFKGKKIPFKHILHGKEPHWHNKRQEKMVQEDKGDLDVVQNKPHASIPSSPNLEWGPGIKEIYMQGITRFCFPSLTLQELSDAMGICEEPCDDILSSIKNAKYMSQKDEDRMRMALEEINHSERITLKAKQSPVAQELQLNIKEKEKKMQEDKDKQAGILSEFCASIYFPPYPQVDTRIKREAAMFKKTRCSFLQPKVQGSSDIGKMAHKKSIYGDISNGVNIDKEHMMQEKDERIKMAKVIPLKEKKSPNSQEIQWDSRDQQKKTQKIKCKSGVVLINTSTSIPDASHLKLDKKIKKVDYVTEVTRYPLPELSHQKSSDAVKKAKTESTNGDITSDVREAKEYMLQKEEESVKISAEKDIMHPKDKELKGKKALSQGRLLNLKEQGKVDREGEEQRKMDAEGKEEGKRDGEVKGEQEVVLPTHWVSESSLTHHELDTRIEGEEDVQGITRSAISQLQLQKSFDKGKIAYTKSVGDDMTNNVKTGQDYEPQNRKDGGKTVNMKHIIYPKGTTSKAKTLPLPHVLSTPRGCGLQIRVQTNIKAKSRHIQERKSELDEVLTRPSLPQFKLNEGIEGKEEKQEVKRSFLSPLWHRESADADKLKYTLSPSNDISSDPKRTKYVPQKEEDKAHIFKKDILTPMSAQPPLFQSILKTKDLQMKIKEQVKRMQKDNKETIMLLSKVCPFVPSLTNLKLDTIEEEECEPGIIKNYVPYRELQQSLPSERIAFAKLIDSHVEEGHLPQKEKDQVQNKTKVDKDLLVIIQFSPSQLQLPESSGAGKIKYADSNKGIISCNVIIKANQCLSHKEAMNRVIEGEKGRIFSKLTSKAETFSFTHLLSRKRHLNIKEQVKDVQKKGKPEMFPRKSYVSLPFPSHLKQDTEMEKKEDTLGITQFYFPLLKSQDPSNSGKKAYTKSFDGYMLKEDDRFKIDIEDKMFPTSMDLKAKKLPLPHILNTKDLKWKRKEQRRKVQEDKDKLVMNVKNICISLLTLPYLKFDTAEREGYMIRITKLPLPQSQSKESSDAVKIAYAETIDGNLCNDVKELKEHKLQKEEKDREKNLDMKGIVDPNDMYLNAKKSPVLLKYNLCNLQWETKEQEGKVQEVTCEPACTMPSKTWTSRPSPLHLNMNIRIKEKSTLTLTRSVSPVNFHKLSYSEEVVNVGPIMSDNLISSQEEKQCMPQNKEEDGVQAKNLMFSKLQEKKIQESKDEPGMLLTQSSTSLLSHPNLKLDKEIQVDDEMLVLKRSVLQRISTAEEIVHNETISGDTIKDVQNKKKHMPQKEERDTKETVAMKGMKHTTDGNLKSKKSPPSYTLHSPKLNLNIGRQEQKKHEGPSKPPSMMLRKVYVSKPSPTNLDLDKSTQVDEEELGIKRPCLLPLMLSALSNAEKTEDTEATSGNVRNRERHISQKGEMYEVRTVDMRIRIQQKEARIPPISHIFNTKKIVLNIKELKEKVPKGKDEPCMVLTRTFLSIPSASSLYLNSGGKTDKDAPRITGSSCPQKNLQESTDTQKTAIRESISCNSKSVKKKTQLLPREEAVHQWPSNFMISVQRRNEIPRVKSEGDLSQLIINSQHEDIYFTGFGTLRSRKRLKCFFTGLEAQPEKYKTETCTTFISYPKMDPMKIENLKKETKIMDNLNHKICPQTLVPLTKKISKEIFVTFDTPVSSKRLSVSEGDDHQTLLKASLGSADSCKFDKPKKDVHGNDKRSKMFSSKMLAPEIKGSLKKMNITESNTHPNREKQETVMKKQVAQWAESGHKTRLNSSPSHKFPLQNGKQKTSLGKGTHKQTTGCPRIQIQSGIYMDVTEFDTMRRKKEQALLIPEQEKGILESLQKSPSPCWTFSLKSGDLKETYEMDTRTTINMKQKELEMEDEKLKIDTNIAILLKEDEVEMQKHTIVNLEREKIKMHTSTPVNLNVSSLKAEESQIKTQVITHTANSCPVKQKYKKKQEMSGTKQNIQPQKSFQKHVLDSFYAYIPLYHKFEGQKGRLTIADLKRELSPQTLTMKIPKHPILQILGNTGRGTPSNRKKLEYGFNKPKKMALRSKGTSGIFIRSLTVSVMSPSHTEETTESEKNLEREKRTCLSKSQEKSPNASKIVKRNNSKNVKKRDQNFTKIVPEDSQPFMVDQQQMQKLPNVKSEASLSSKIHKNNLTPQTEERVVPGHDILKTIKEPDLLMIGQEEKAPKSMLTPTEYPCMSEDPKENVETHVKCTLYITISPPGVEEPEHETQPLNIVEHASPLEQRDHGDLVQDTTTQRDQQQNTFPETVPILLQIKSNEIKIVADSTSAESLLPLYEAIKNVFESQIQNMIQDKVYADILEKLKAHKPDVWKLPPFAGGPHPTSPITHPKLHPKSILECFTPKLKNKLTNHLESKALEIKLNLIPETAKQSFQKFNFSTKQAIVEDNSWRLYPRHKKMYFMSLEGIDTITLNLKHKYQKDSPHISCMKTLTVNVSSGSKEIITKLKSINKLESGTSFLTSANEMPSPHILQNYSIEEKDKLLVHFSIKTLEIQMKVFPRIVMESYEMADAQERRKPSPKCIHSCVEVPKPKNRILLLFEEKSLHQIHLDLQYKCLRFLLGLPVESMFPKPNTLPKHILKLNTVAICKKVDNSGESGSLSIDTEPLEKHISFKKQSPHENSSWFKQFLEPTHGCAPDLEQGGTKKEDTTVLSVLKSYETAEKEKQYHVSFQETNTHESFDLKTQEDAPSLVDSHSIQISEDFTDSQIYTESSTNLEEFSALEVHESEECMFLQANPLIQESQNILFELQKGIPLMKKIKTDLKSFYGEDSGSHHSRDCRKHSSIVTPPFYKSHKSKKYRSSSKMQSPDWLCHRSLSTIEVPFASSSVSFSEETLSWITKNKTNYSLAPLTESNIKLHLAKTQSEFYGPPETKERKKAKFDLFKKSVHWDCDYSYTQSKEKLTRKKKVCDYESERADYFPSKRKLASKPHQEDINFHPERKQNQPFFYACIPADSLEMIPKTIRWTIPQKTLRKRNFRVPLVAKISSSCNIWSSSRKLLGSILESFNPVH